MLLYHFLLMCNAFTFDLKKQDIFFFKKNYVDFDFISLIHSYVYIHIAIYYPRIIQQCHIQHSKNLHHLYI